MIRESVKKLELPKTSLSQESVDSIGFSSKEDLINQLNDNKPDLQMISKLELDELKNKQDRLGYFNSATLTQYLSERGFEEEDKSQSCCSEKVN